MFWVVQNKLHRVLHLINVEPFAVESRCLHRSVQHPATQYKLCVNWLNIFLSKSRGLLSLVTRHSDSVFRIQYFVK